MVGSVMCDIVLWKMFYLFVSVVLSSRLLVCGLIMLL